MSLKTKWLNLPYWQRGILLGSSLAIILFLVSLLYAATDWKNFCYPSDPPLGPLYSCGPLKAFIKFITNFAYKDFLLWIAAPVIILATVLEIMIGKLTKPQ